MAGVRSLRGQCSAQSPVFSSLALNFPIITDPHFYAVAIPAVLLLGVSKSGFGAGFGSLAVPFMALVVTVPQAAAILMPVLLLMDLLGLAAFRRDFDPRLLRVPHSVRAGGHRDRRPAVPGAAGAHGGGHRRRLHAAVPGPAPAVPAAARTTRCPRRWRGALLTTISGFTSFIAHAGGPPVNAYVIPLRLTPVVFTATMAYFFFVVNLSKWVPYAWLGLLDWRNMATSLVLLPIAPLGVWVGVRIARRIDPVWFYRFVYLGMLLTGLKLSWDGFLA